MPSGIVEAAYSATLHKLAPALCLRSAARWSPQAQLLPFGVPSWGQVLLPFPQTPGTLQVFSQNPRRGRKSFPQLS